MATKIGSLSPSTRNLGYPLDEWLDGSAWLLRQGEDFTSTLASIKNTLTYHAYRRGLMLASRMNSRNGTIEVQARPR